MTMVIKVDRPRREEVVLDDQRVGQLEQLEQAERGRRGPTQQQRVEQQQPTLRLQSKTRFCKNMQVSNKMRSKSSLPKFDEAATSTTPKGASQTVRPAPRTSSAKAQRKAADRPTHGDRGTTLQNPTGTPLLPAKSSLSLSNRP